MLKTGKCSVLGIDFDIVDPERNGGRSCLVLSSGRKKFPAEKSIALNGAEKEFRYLYLLHASARTPKPQMPVGTIVAEYADGSTKEIPVLAGRDVGDRRQPSRLPNGAVASIGENNNSFAGLYLSQFPIQGTPSGVTFRAADRLQRRLDDRRRRSRRPQTESPAARKPRRTSSRAKTGCRWNSTAIPSQARRLISRTISTLRRENTVRSSSAKRDTSPSATRRRNGFGSSDPI